MKENSSSHNFLSRRELLITGATVMLSGCGTGVGSSNMQTIQPTIWINTAGYLGTIDPTTLKYTPQGLIFYFNTGPYSPGSIVWDISSSQRLLAISSQGAQLHVFQLHSTGFQNSDDVLTDLGTTKRGYRTLGFALDGTLYAASEGTEALPPVVSMINPNTGNDTPIITLTEGAIGGIAVNPADGMGYITTTASNLIKIDFAKKKADVVGSVGIKIITGLTFFNGTLYGFTSDRVIFTINPTTAEKTQIGLLPSNAPGGGVFGASAPTIPVTIPKSA